MDNWHIGALCEHLEAVTRGELPQLLINIPPGCSKSLLTCVFWPMWEWANDPSVRWFFASYDQELATRDSMKCRTLVRSDWYQARWGRRFRFKDDQNQKTYYQTDQGGYRMATSVNGHGTGEHPDRIVIDDPHNVKKAESEAERRAVIEWWDLTMSTRGVARNARRVIIMQRLHVDDLSGHVLKQGGFTHICLPMRYEPGRMPDTPRGWNDPRQHEGELLTPLQFDEARVQRMEAALGAYGTAGQLQQRPHPKGGALFKEGKFRRYSFHGDHFLREGRPGILPLADCAIFVIVDGAASSKSTADHTVIAVFAVAPDGDLLVLEVNRLRLEIEQIIPAVDRVCAAWRPQWVGIESNGMQIWFVKEARRREHYPHIPVVRELDPEGKTKAHRAAPAVIMAEQGQVYLPEEGPLCPWVGEFEAECFSFTGQEGRPDDQVDCLSYAVLAIVRLGYDGTAPGLPLALEDRAPF